MSLAIEIGRAVLAARAIWPTPLTPRSQLRADSVSFTARSSTSSAGSSAGSPRRSPARRVWPGRWPRLRIDFQNENLIARTDDGEILAVVPISSAWSTKTLRNRSRPRSSATACGWWSSASPPEMLKTQEALRFIGPEAFGYDGVPYVPLPGRFGAGCQPEPGIPAPGGPRSSPGSVATIRPRRVAELAVVVAAEIASDRVPVEQLGVERSVVAAVERIGQHLLGAGVSRGASFLETGVRFAEGEHVERKSG